MVVLNCSGATNVTGLVRGASRSPPPLNLAVAAVGYAVDAFDGSTNYLFRPANGAGSPTVALNLRYSHISNVAGRWNGEGQCDDTQGRHPSAWRVNPAGFLGVVVAKGVSGGPVLDMHCRVLGVIHGHACETSVFVSLTPVDAYLLRVAAGGG